MPVHEESPRRLDPSSVDRWRSTCPVRPQHKSVFPTVLCPPYVLAGRRGPPGLRAGLWGVLKAAGGNMPARTKGGARLRGLSRRPAST